MDASTQSEQLVVAELLNKSLLPGFEQVACTQDAAKSGIFEIMAIVFGVAISATNIVVVAAILRGGKKLQKATFYCIGNLAVADLLAGLLLLWVFGLQKVVLPFRTPNSELIQKGVWTITVWSSLLSQILISIDRYGHVTRCNRRQSQGLKAFKWGNSKRRKLVLTGIALTWIIPVVTFVVPVAAFWNCRDTCACYIKNNKPDVIYMWCLPVDKCSQVNPSFTKSSMLYLGLILLFMPLIPIALYMQIFCFVQKSTQKLNNTMGKVSRPDSFYTKEPISKESSSSLKNDVFSVEHSDADPASVARSPTVRNCPKDAVNAVKQKIMIPKRFSIRHQRSYSSRTSQSSKPSSIDEAKGKARLLSATQRRNQSRDMKLMRTLMIILGLFVITTVPLGALFVSAYAVTDKRYLSAVKIMLTISLFNSLLNPWVYFWRFREMRIAIRDLLCPCARSFDSAGCFRPCLSTNNSHRPPAVRKSSLKPKVREFNSESELQAIKYSTSKE